MNLRRLLVFVMTVSSPVGLGLAFIVAPNLGWALFGLIALAGGTLLAGSIGAIILGLLWVGGPLLFLTNTNINQGISLFM